MTTDDSPNDVRRLLSGLPVPPAGASQDALFEAIYSELRAIAAGALNGQGASHTLQPTAVVHEAYLKLARAEDLVIESREHFLCLATKAMRQVLLNHARDRVADKRGGGRLRVTLHDVERDAPDRDCAILDLEAALEQLERVDSVQARIVELRFFGGLTFSEIARVESIPETTVRREWRMARAELMLALRDHGIGDATP